MFIEACKAKSQSELLRRWFGVSGNDAKLWQHFKAAIVATLRVVELNYMPYIPKDSCEIATGQTTGDVGWSVTNHNS